MHSFKWMAVFQLHGAYSLLFLEIKHQSFSFPFPLSSHPHYLKHYLVFIIYCHTSVSQPPTTLVWCTLGWISTFGWERRGVSFDRPWPWMKLTWRESALSAPVTAACLIGPTPYRWHDMMGDDTEQQHVGSQMLAGGPRASKTLTDATL